MFKKFGLPSAIVLGLVSGLAYAVPAEPSHKISSVSASGHDRFYGVAFDAQGDYYAVGSVADGTAGTDDAKFLIAKYKADGTLDASFGNAGYAVHNLAVGGNGEVARSIAVDADGKILVAGAVEHVGADARDRDLAVIRLNQDGSLDQSYGVQGIAIVDLSTGEVNGSAYIADGFGGMALDAAGNVVIEGSQKREGGLDTDFAIARLTPAGVLDETFGTAGKVTVDIRNLSASPKTPLVAADGSIYGTGYQRDGSVVLPVIFKLDNAGQIVSSYGQGGIFSQPVLKLVSEVYSAVLQGDSLVTVGYGRDSDSESIDFLSIRVDATGALDSTYGNGGHVRIDADGFNDNGRNMTVLPDGRLALIGGGRYSSANVDGMLAILSADGVADETFAENGAKLFDFGGANDFLWGAAVSPSGDKLIAVGIKGVSDGNDDAAIVTVPLK